MENLLLVATVVLSTALGVSLGALMLQGLLGLTGLLVRSYRPEHPVPPR